MTQITFQLPEIDREETKKRVEAALDKYRFYLLSVPKERLPIVTATYSLIPPTHTNAFRSSIWRRKEINNGISIIKVFD
jgi:ArpU family phage transcriptional regulator